MATLEDIAKGNVASSVNLPTYDLVRLKKEHQRQLINGDTDRNDFNDWYLNMSGKEHQ